MRTIDCSIIKTTIKELCYKANIELRKDILAALGSLRNRETNTRARYILDILIQNARIARIKGLPVCQDTGMVVVYLNIGQEVRIRGDIDKAVNNGVKQAYRDGYFRKSVVKDPLIRKNTQTNLPSIIHYRVVRGKKIDIRVAVKGFGCENVSRTRMFRPTDSVGLIEDFIVATVKEIGSKACPPMYIGIGMGGTLDKAVCLSKEAVFRRVGELNTQPHIARLERRILRKLTRLNIGPMGLGGSATVLGVSILTYPTHIAGLPVAVNISCYATRDARKVI